MSSYLYPQHVEYWVTSDGQKFNTLEGAQIHEKMINSPDYHKTYSLIDCVKDNKDFWEQVLTERMYWF